MHTLSTAAVANALNGALPSAAPATAPRPKRAGRERTCHQCGTIYRSIRTTSLYCSTPCRKRAARGTAATGGPKAGPDSWGPISKALRIGGYVGRIGPLSPRSTQPHTYGLLVDPDTAHADLADLFNRRGWGLVSRKELAGALKADGIQGFNTRSPAAAEQPRWQDRQRPRAARDC
ncbi:MAG: hypothetical protein CFE32_15310 [Alphaproteobacteria bacterium PA3]|nr:MAG: hypothetical protein CFE32_15310 [Alphaproteobacteria bacterium PA3]